MKVRQPAILEVLNQLKTSPPAEKGSLSGENREAIRRSLALSFLVYMPLKHAKQELKRAGYGDVSRISRIYTGTQVICGTKDGAAYITFRGSESLLDWVVDFLCIPFFWPLRHMGFSLAWYSVRRKVCRWLAGLPQPVNGIVLSGHSLGGGISHLAALDLAEAHPIAKVVTFGAPKACFLGTATKYDTMKIKGNDARTLRDVTLCIVNQRDIVAKVPPALFGFRAVGQLVYIDKKNVVHEGDVAVSVRQRETMADADFLMNFFKDEPTVAFGVIGGGIGALTAPRVIKPAPKPELTMDDVYVMFQKGVRWVSANIPALKTALIPPVLYLALSVYFMRSGLSHLTGKYVGVFFSGPAEIGFAPFRPSKLKQLVSAVLRGAVGIAFLFLFGKGLFSVVSWSFGTLSKGH